MYKRCLSIVIVLSLAFTGFVLWNTNAEVTTTSTSAETDDLEHRDVTEPVVPPEAPSLFKENRGQWDPAIEFIGEAPFGVVGVGSGRVFYDLIESEMVDEEPVVTGGTLLHNEFVGGNVVRSYGVGEGKGKTNFLIGSDRDNWARGVRSFQAVRMDNVWDGVDLTYMFHENDVKYEYELESGVSPDVIEVRMSGQEYLALDGGDLVIGLPSGEEMRDSGLSVYYNDGTREPITARFRLLSEDTYGFELEDYDITRGAVIDPLIYSTYLGGYRYDYGHGVAINDDGQIYVTGYTYYYSGYTQYPKTSGSYTSPRQGSYEVFITKFEDDNSMIYSTYFGGSSSDYGYDVAVDSNGDPYILGETSSSNFPTTSGVYQTSRYYYYTSVFITKMSSDGSFLTKDIAPLDDLLGMMRRIRRKIILNYAWSFLYNLVGLGLAAAGLLSPTYCAFGMVFSNVVVIFNSMMRVKGEAGSGRPDSP